MYVTLSEVRSDIHKTYREGYGRGYPIEYKCLEDPYSVVLGSTLYLYGAPATGKTQFAFEVLIQLSNLHGFHHAICSPETGKPHEIYQELVQMVVQKDLVDTFNGQMTDDERNQAEIWVESHFTVINHENEQGETITLEEFYEEVDRVSMEKNIKIHTTLLDPFDEVDIKWGSGMRDLILEKKLIWIRKNASITNRYHIITTHIRDQHKSKTIINKQEHYYFPPPDPQDIRHGQEWYRRGFMMIGLWRPPTFLNDEHGEPYKDNCTVLCFGKQKPKMVKKQGCSIKRVKLYWDDNRHRYYEVKYGVNLYPKPIVVSKKEDPFIQSEADGDDKIF